MIRRSIDFAGSESWAENFNTSIWMPFAPQYVAVAWSQNYAKSWSGIGSWARSGAWVKNRIESWHWRDNL